MKIKQYGNILTQDIFYSKFTILWYFQGHYYQTFLLHLTFGYFKSVIDNLFLNLIELFKKNAFTHYYKFFVKFFDIILFLLFQSTCGFVLKYKNIFSQISTSSDRT